jgi:hypothetical protein
MLHRISIPDVECPQVFDPRNKLKLRYHELLASLVCLITVSLLTPPPTESHLRAFAEN